MDINSETLSYLGNSANNKAPVNGRVSPSKLNYDNIRYGQMPPNSYMNSNSSIAYAQHYNNGPYLNVPFSSKTFNHENNVNNQAAYNNSQSPLPPPPPLPSYVQLHNGDQNIVQPTPQQPQSGNYLDLSLNRENRGSAFEVYRKPGMESMLTSVINDSPIFHGLPPPPPPLSINDFK